MTSFHETRFPVDISYGAVGGPKFNTTVLTLSSGSEKRNINWSHVRCEYDIAYGVKTPVQMDTVRTFFFARRGKAYGFRYKDFGDFLLTRQNIGTTDGATATFQIFKRYTSAGINYDRNLQKIVANADAQTSLSVWVDGTLKTEAAGAGNYTVDRATGIITLGATLAALTGKTVEAQCEFDVPVRFDTDYLNINMQSYQIQSWASIPLVEVRDIS